MYKELSRFEQTKRLFVIRDVPKISFVNNNYREIKVTFTKQ